MGSCKESALSLQLLCKSKIIQKNIYIFNIYPFPILNPSTLFLPMKVKVNVSSDSLQPLNYTDHGILQARILEC